MYSLDNGLCLAWLFLLALNNNSLVCHVVVNHYCLDHTRTLHNWPRFLNHFVSSSIPYLRQVLGICIQASWHFLEYFTTVRGHNRHERHCKGQVVPCSIQHKSTYITWYMPTRVAPCSCDDTVNATSPLKNNEHAADILLGTCWRRHSLAILLQHKDLCRYPPLVLMAVIHYRWEPSYFDNMMASNTAHKFEDLHSPSSTPCCMGLMKWSYEYISSMIDACCAGVQQSWAQG